MTRRVLITGSRNWTDTKTLYGALTDEWMEHGDFILIHGGARGADEMAGHWASWSNTIRDFNVTVEVYPADWNAHGRGAGAIRNQKMVDTGADICLAFPTDSSRGTLDCIRRARAAKIPVKVFHENPKNANFMQEGKNK